MDQTVTPAKADRSHDRRFTHPSASSPGGPGGQPTIPTAYPKWVGGVIVQSEADEAALTGGAATGETGRASLVAVIALAVLSLLACAGFAQAQPTTTLLTRTTISGALTTTQTTVVVASATNISVGTEIYVGWEAMRVTGVSGTTLTVIRGYDGTATAPHATSAVLYSGVGNFHPSDPPFGSCSPNTAIPTWVNVRTGNIWECRSLVWAGTNVAGLVYASSGP